MLKNDIRNGINRNDCFSAEEAMEYSGKIMDKVLFPEDEEPRLSYICIDCGEDIGIEKALLWDGEACCPDCGEARAVAMNAVIAEKKKNFRTYLLG